MGHKIINIGDSVHCDLCNEDYTGSSVSGGIYFSGNAVCPTCTPEFMKKIIKHEEKNYIESICPKGKSYADWVREDLRGGKPGTISITTFDKN